MALSLRPIAPQDLERVAYLRVAAFDGAPAARAMRPGPITPETVSWMKGRIEKDFSSPNNTFFGIFDDVTNDLIAYAEWEMVDAKARETPEQKAEWPSFMNKDALDEFWTQYEQVKHDVMGDRDYFLLSILATDKAHQGRGAASMLLRWGIEYAAGKNLDIFLDATEAGKPLYEKYGFEVRKAREMDLRPYGVDSTALNWGMLRLPGPLR